MIKLLKGSIFDSKCDLFVIPCNSYGGVTSFVRQELMANQLPVFGGKISSGDVIFKESTNEFVNSSVIGYAASVDVITKCSSKEIITSILKKIKSYCKEQSLSKINIPLLGTGAGKLSPEDVFEVMTEEFGKETDYTLCVYVISPKYFETLTKAKIVPDKPIIKRPRVFVSYTGTDENNKKWVKELVCKLRTVGGVNARVDIFHLKRGQDLPQWMANEIIMADKVLLIGDKYYAEKANIGKGGVGWETMLIQGDMLSDPLKNKYVVIVRTEDINDGSPFYTKSRYSFHWNDDDKAEREFDELLVYLYDCEESPPPISEDIPEIIKTKIIAR